MDCPSLPLRVATLPLRPSCSEVQGPHVLLSYYVAHVISCGPGVLSSFVTLPGLSLWFFRTCLGLCRAPPDVRSAFFCFGILSSSWPLPRLGALGFPLLCLFLALFPGAGMGCPLLSSQVLWRRLRPLPCSSVCGYRPNQRETIAMGDCYILCRRSGVTWSAWAAHRQRCVRFPFCCKV